MLMPTSIKETIAHSWDELEIKSHPNLGGRIRRQCTADVGFHLELIAELAWHPSCDTLTKRKNLH
jgi:hypothetical protein